MQWTEEQKILAEKYWRVEHIPRDQRKYKCHTCHLIVDETPCPGCGEQQLAIMCPLDHCHCSHEITSGISYCPLCGEPVCPECGSHDVVQISRVPAISRKSPAGMPENSRSSRTGHAIPLLKAYQKAMSGNKS